MIENEKYTVKGMTCSSCSYHVNKAVSSLAGVKECNVNLLTESMLVSYEEPCTSSKIILAVSNAGYKAYLFDQKTSKNENNDKSDLKNKIIRLVLSIILLIPLFYISMAYMTMDSWHWPLGALKNNAFYVALIEMILSSCIMLIQYKFFVSGFKSLIHKAPNMDTLVALGSSISFIYSLAMMFVMSHYVYLSSFDKVMMYSMNLSFETSGMVPTLISIGKTLEEYSKGKTTNAIKSLLNLAPKNATVIRDEKEYVINIDDVKVDDIFIVKPGESVPVDGVIIKGNTSIDESSLTGESLPVEKNADDYVSSATINQNGTIYCKATKVGSETTLNQIVRMVEDASSTKTKISAVADKVAGVFVPVVLSISLIVFICWLIFGSSFVSSNTSVTLLSYSLERAIAVLVISCPCALGLATPVAIMVGNGLGAKNGILFKNAIALEETGKCDFIVLDKTGTITKGEMEVNSIVSSNEDELLCVAYSIEKNSEHPLSKAITKYCLENNVVSKDVSSFKALPGFGVSGYIDSKLVLAGNAKLMKENNIDISLMEKEANIISLEGKTPLYFAYDNKLLGIISVGDSIKEDSKEAIAKMQNEGMSVIMLTGDNYNTAKKIASDVGIKYFISDVLPDGKLAVIKELKKYGKVMMVGDGVNDAPALTLANVSMAIKKGSDIALDSADVILMKSSLMDCIKAIRLSRHTYLNIIENLFWAFIYNIIMIPIAAGAFSALGLSKLKPWMGAAAMALSSLTVVLNALRINLFSLDKNRKSRKCKEVPNEILNFNKCNISCDNEKSIVVSVPDMMCENCVKHVSNALNKVNNVLSVDVSLSTLSATIKYKDSIDIKEVEKALKEEGYKYNGYSEIK